MMKDGLMIKIETGSTAHLTPSVRGGGEIALQILMITWNV